MKITFVLPNLRLYGGIKSTIQMADALQQLGHDVTIAHPLIEGRDGQPWWKPRKTAVQAARLAQNLIKPPRWFNFSGTLLAIPYCSERFLPDADVLVLTWWADVAKLHNINECKGKVVHFVRSYETWGGPKALVNEVYGLNIPRICNSKALSAQLPHESLCAITNGLDDIFVTDHPAKSQTTRLNIGVLYRQQGWKRMNDALAVLTNIKRENTGVRFILFGESIRPEHEPLIKALRDCEYHQLPAGKALLKVYQEIDIFLFTSDETEAFGNPPLEAMAVGCAVVATKVGAIPDYSVHAESALHCEPRDVKTMTSSIQRLIDDPGLRLGLGTTAKTAAQAHRWINQAEKLEAVLKTMTTDHHSEA
mgnify:CR=1 FL=1